MNNKRQNPNSLFTRKRRSVVALISLVVILAIIGIIFHHKSQTLAPEPQSKDSHLLASAKTISPFTLTDDNGAVFTNANLEGHWTFLFFGFSRCGDVCPTTLAQLNDLVTQLKKDLPAQVIPQVVMVSVDTETDTTAIMHNYVKNFNPDFIGTTADTDTLATFSKDLGMYYAKVSQGSHGYMVNHTAELYLFNPDGKWVAIYTYPHQIDELAKSYQNIAHPNNDKT